MDETYVGGKAKNRHAKAREKTYWGGRSDDKAPVVSIVDVESGAVRSTVADGTVTGALVMDLLGEHTERSMTTMHTDANQSYRNAAFLMAGHHYVDHSRGEYVTEKSLGTNKAENYFSQLKRSLDGTYHCVSQEHLPRYVGEFDYRATTRKVDDGTRSATVVSRSYGRRLTYADLIAVGPVAQGTRRRPPGRQGPRQ